MNWTYTTFRQRIPLLSWVLPLVLALIVVAYQLGLVRWIHGRYQEPTHYLVEILFDGVVGPLLAFWSLRHLGHWLDEKELAERQARHSERRLAAITTASTAAILGIDADSHIESWNRGVELLFSRTAGEDLGRPLSNLLGSGEAAAIESRWLADTVRQAGFVRDRALADLRWQSSTRRHRSAGVETRRCV